MTVSEIFDDLMEKIKINNPDRDLSDVTKAYEMALNSHGEQLRKSGEPYIIHPLSVAVILAELGLDIETIIGGILHDVIEDTEFKYEDLVHEFSQSVADLVDGVTKLDKIELQKALDEQEREILTAQMEETQERRIREKKLKYEEEREKEREKEEALLRERLSRNDEMQAENYRKMFIAMSKDIRVLVIKIADRLHNLRTLKYMALDKQKKIAKETLDIYAPLAHRLGMAKIRYEIEDIAFRYYDSDAYHDLVGRISRKQREREDYVRRIVENIEVRVREEGIKALVEGRPKQHFSIYKKMMRKSITLDQIYDLYAIRAIVDTVADCYGVLGIVHDMYTPIQGRFKDYISMPKANKYQSLHTTLMGHEGEPFELQIRTWDMHKTAEYGIAAHWKYKENKDSKNTEGNDSDTSWLSQILEWQRELSDNKEYLSELKTELSIFQEHIYCFTPRGEVVSLAAGSTPIDFAYAIHSAVGNTMIGARVNGNIASFDQKLESSDRVEIVTSRNSTGPKHEWLSIVKSSTARSKINQWFKNQNKEENINKGKELLESEARRKDFEFSDLLTDMRQDIVLRKYNYNTIEQLYASVGHGGIKEGQIINRLVDEHNRDVERQRRVELQIRALDETVISEVMQIDESEAKRKNQSSGVVIQGVGDLAVRFSKCCSPVPGDEIVGFTTRGRGVSVHRTDCANIVNLPVDERSRLLEASWNIPKSAQNTSYRADLNIICEDRAGLILDISKIFSDDKVPVKNLNARSQDNEAIFNVTIEVTSRDQLDKVCKKILAVQGVAEIKRMTM
ncbi:MAG: bifunctional (p)ppGpp synthetase/guanosine-3',5'-bis(diphosphate) 3'-pyrophosphohydrolase [Defluviitaleaceae bacterium]|nr:bifunctional (p)ppGpp synthetase/guanosine-3',5'-bis(diphosphate) 3'-pyrophosphohydrolase [Defluviitaleaceae bacterium]